MKFVCGDKEHQGARVYDPEGISAQLTSQGGGLGAKTGLYKVGNIKGAYESNGRVYSAEGVAKTLSAGNKGGGERGQRTGLYMIDDPSRGKGLVDKNESPTLRSEAHGNLPAIMENSRIRRLTPTECERLQGFEDGWTAKGIMDGKEVDISDSQRYKCLGNAVSTPVIKWIATNLFSGNNPKPKIGETK